MPRALAANPCLFVAAPCLWAGLALLPGCAGDGPVPVAAASAAEESDGENDTVPVMTARAERGTFGERVAAPLQPAPGSDTRPCNLIVLAHFARDGRPAAGLHLRLIPLDGPAGAERGSLVMTRFLDNSDLPLRHSSRAAGCVRTGADGLATFAAVPPGRYLVRDDRGGPDVPVRVVAAGDTPLEYRVAAGVRIEGVVVRPDGAAVAGAVVEVWLPDRAEEIETLATSDWAGRFAIDDVQPGCSFGVRAEEHFASQELRVSNGPVQTMRVELQPDACSLDGFVVTGAMQPIEGAVVHVGPGRGYGPRALWVRTDARGHFRLFGLDCDEYPVVVQADGFQRALIRAVVETPAQFVLSPKPD